MTSLTNKGCIIKNPQWTTQETAHDAHKITFKPPVLSLAMVIDTRGTSLGETDK